MESNISLIVLISVFVISNGSLVVESRTFDQDLYNRVLDSEECKKQMEFLKSNDTRLYGRFLDSGIRTPRGLSKMNSVDLGDYHTCLEILETREDMNIQGKYCFLQIPFNQTLKLPFPEEDFFGYGITSEAKNFAVGNINKLIRSEARDAVLQGSLSVAICIPKVCTSQEFTNRHFDLSAIGFEFDEQFCRLPNDKPWVPVDYVAIGIFSFIALITVLGTLYDVTHTFVLKTDKNGANIYIRMFSIYTNSRRLVTFVPNTNALECLDGVRSLSMLWIILGHSYSMHNFNLNLLDGLQWITSVGAVWIFTALSAVDTFFFMAGILLVYTSVGKMSRTKFLKNLHVFYLNRLLRMFPLLAALILLEASVFHRMVDGPYWVAVARNAENCRTYWWTTLLHVQNYVNPSNLCIGHSWYIAIDIQLYIVSPLVLFWTIGNNKKAAWSALISAFLAIFVACTLWNSFIQMPGDSIETFDMDFYMRNFYYNTLTRGSPFFVGMIVGYVIYIYKGQEIKLNKYFVLVSWTIALGLIAACFYTSYIVRQPDRDNSVLELHITSIMRVIWSIGLGWIIFACAKGYGGPINWLLSLSIWKIPARISYAMYLYHYPIMSVIAGMQLSPQYFSQGAKIYDFMAITVISLAVSFIVTAVIDAPFSSIIKMVLGGQRKRRLSTENVTDLSKLGTSAGKDVTLSENNAYRRGPISENIDVHSSQHLS